MESTEIYSMLHFHHKYDLDLIHCNVREATKEKTEHFHVGCNKTYIMNGSAVPTMQCAVRVLVSQITLHKQKWKKLITSQ
jgi:hypothetical protein